MVFEELLTVVTLIALLAAAYSDLKIREVPNWLNFALIFSVMGIRLIFSFQLGWTIFISGILGLIVCIGLAYLFYYTSQWGGGDSKLLMGMGAVIGITYPFNDSSWNLLWFFLALLFIGAAYGLIWMTVLSIKKWTIFAENFKKSLKEKKILHFIVAGLSLIFVGLTLWKTFFWPLIILPWGFFYLFLFVTVVEESCFQKKVAVKDLTEGDWLVEPLKVKGKTILDKKTLGKKDIEKLSDLVQQGKINKVTIKEGIPFVPNFLLAYLLLVFGQEVIQRVRGLF